MPEITTTNFYIQWNKLKEAIKNNNGIPYIIGPFTFIKLSNCNNFETCLESIAYVYKELIKTFDYVHIDEPAFVLDLSNKEIDIIKKVYKIMDSNNIYLFTYYDSVDFLNELYDLPLKGIGVDFVHSKDNIEIIKNKGFPSDKILFAGVVDGKNIWRTDIIKIKEFISWLYKYAKNIVVANACPLYHLPITIKGEKIPIINKIAFAEERLYELKLISSNNSEDIKNWLSDIHSDFGCDKNVQDRLKNIKEADFTKLSYNERAVAQKEVIDLPLFPTTTIGSFPQTKEIRERRASFNKKEINEQEYKSFIKEKIREVIKLQEDIGLDVLVHGEYERSDMVEYFATKLNGFATTEQGWIISYGTRVYRPPIIYGDVKRTNPMTLEEITFAQSLTTKPVKGILTGPVTLVSWSYVREDIPIEEVAYQIALAINDEVRDLESNGIKIIQIDEPAFREKVPIKKRDWAKYFDWAIKSFKIASNCQKYTQIHTHMCYSEFGEILDKIIELDFDVLSIEGTRSKGEIIKYFRDINFNRGIGIGVWDIHSKAIPSVDSMKEIINKTMKYIPKDKIWLNPDCGLKTRSWEEVIPSLKNLVKSAKELRERA